MVRAELLESGWVRGTVRIDVHAQDAIRVWMYPDRLAVAPSALNQQNARWTFPRGEDLSEVRVRMRVDGRDVEPTWEREPVGTAHGRDYRGGDLLVSLPPGDRHIVQIAFVYRLPERFGRLGRVGDRLTLTAPWYPVVVATDGGARLNVAHDVELTLPEDVDVALPEGARRDGRVVRIHRPGAFVPVVVAPRLRRWRRTLMAGYELEVVATQALYEAPRPDARGVQAIHDIARVDVLGQIERVANDAIRTLTLANVPTQPRLLRVVLTPSRTEMAATAPGIIAVSDRIYEIFPLDQIRAFHDRALRRAMFQSMLEPRVDAIEAPADRSWSEDLRAVILSDLDEVRRQGEVQTAQDLIGWAGFHPAIDQLLYAPQVTFVDVYFGTVDEPDPFRDHPGRSREPTSRGRRMLESARDVLSEDDLRAWSRELIRGEKSARDALREIDPEAAQRLDAWLHAPSTAVNYRLVEVHSDRTEDGTWRHRIVVERQGDSRIEPVEVRMEDRDGTVLRGTWDGEGERGEIVLESDAEARMSTVRVDPRGRLVQSSRVADGHPRRDDSTGLPWRPPLLQGFNLAGSSEGVITGFIDFALRRRYDLENSVALRIATGARSTGGLLRYRRGVGRKRDNNSRIGFVTAGIGVDRLRGRFAEDGDGGVRASALLSAGFSTQRYFLDPRKGAILIGSIRGSVVRRDTGRTTYTFAPSLRGNLTLANGLRGATVLVGGINWVFGDPLDNERPGLGGRFLLRGYQTNEAVGRGRVFAVIEQRFTPTLLSDLNWNILHIAWVREIQLALFGGGGVVFFEPGEDGRDFVPGVEVGAGIRVHFEWGGIQPGVLSLDWAAPLIRESAVRNALPPFTFIFGFEQYF